jgi:hypothetical protein
MAFSSKNVVVSLLHATAAACATAPHPDSDESGATAGKYPRRPANCKLQVFHSPAPGVAAWDDLGVAEVGCYLDVGVQQCMQRLKEEACRMGGDIIYNVPNKPARPKDQVLVYRAQVAHTRSSDKKGVEEPPPPEQDAGPIEPLVLPPAAASQADGGNG